MPGRFEQTQRDAEQNQAANDEGKCVLCDKDQQQQRDPRSDKSSENGNRNSGDSTDVRSRFTTNSDNPSELKRIDTGTKAGSIIRRIGTVIKAYPMLNDD